MEALRDALCLFLLRRGRAKAESVTYTRYVMTIC